LYLSGESSALMNTLLPKEVVRKLSNASSYSDALDILQGTIYGNYLQSGDVEGAMSHEYNELNSFIKTECPESSIVDFFLLPFDYDNIETICKCKLLGLSEDSYLEIEGKYSFDFLKDVIRNKRHDKLNNQFMFDMLVEYKKKISTQTMSSKEIDYLFQKYKFKNIKSLFKSGMMKSLADFALDTENISIALRCASKEELLNNMVCTGTLSEHFLIDVLNRNPRCLSSCAEEYKSLLECVFNSNNIRNLAKYELMRRQMVFKFIEDYLYNPETPAIFLKYIYSKIYEIENLHLIINLQKENLGEKIKTRLIE